MSVSKKIRDLIKAGIPEDEAVAQALGVAKSSAKKKPEPDQALPTIADAFKKAKIKKRK